MKKSIIYLAISATLTFSGCDYLDDMPYDWAQPDDIFTNEQNYLKPINQVYAYIPEGFNHVGNAFLDAATNDGISTIIDSDIHKLSRGYVTSSNPIEECWNKSYKGIQQAIFARKFRSAFSVSISAFVGIIGEMASDRNSLIRSRKTMRFSTSIRMSALSLQILSVRNSRRSALLSK